MDEIKSERVATQQELTETLTAILRGETTAAIQSSFDVVVQRIKNSMKHFCLEQSCTNL